MIKCSFLLGGRSLGEIVPGELEKKKISENSSI